MYSLKFSCGIDANYQCRFVNTYLCLVTIFFVPPIENVESMQTLRFAWIFCFENKWVGIES